MSHYQHNINAPQFPPGVHMSHYSLTNTTLIGQDVQQRLWEKYWGQQYPVPPAPYMWPQPGMYYHGYPYGVPNTFHTVPTHGGFDQLHRPVMRQNGERSDGGVVQQCSESFRDKDVLVEVLEEGNIWSTNREQSAAKQQQGTQPLRPKIVDPVTDDLNWELFSAGLADGIVVSILDSFVLELPVLDFITVKSVFERLNKSSPQLDDQLQVQHSTEKEEYFKEIVGQTKLRKSSDKNSESRETVAKEFTSLALQQRDQSEEKRLVQSSGHGKTTGKVLEQCMVEKHIHEGASLRENTLCQSEENRHAEDNEQGRSTDKALEQADSAISSNDEAREDKGAAIQTWVCSSVLNTIGKTFHEEDCNSDAPFISIDKSNITQQEDCFFTTNVTSMGKSNTSEYEISIKSLLTDATEPQANKEETLQSFTNISSSKTSQT